MVITFSELEQAVTDKRHLGREEACRKVAFEYSEFAAIDPEFEFKLSSVANKIFPPVRVTATVSPQTVAAVSPAEIAAQPEHPEPVQETEPDIRGYVNQIYPDKKELTDEDQKQLVDDTMDHLNLDLSWIDTVATIVDSVIIERAEAAIEDEPDDPEPQFGDIDGPSIYIGTTDGYEVRVDRNGVDMYTGVVHELTPEQKKKLATADEESKQISMNVVVGKATYDFTGPRVERKYDYDGLVVSGAYCLWLGARKAEKSLFALRKAMHDACGKNWFNHQNMLGPVTVLYFDTENDKAEVDERYREIITEFSGPEQDLIRKNLTIRLGKEFKRQNIDIEFDNKPLWEALKRTSQGVRVVYLDCWYQLQSIKAVDNQAQKIALEMFEKYFPNTTLFLLHHTGRESEESLLRKNPSWLRILGAERWSNKSSGGNVLTKKAELIICQERYVERDEEGVENDWFIDFQAYSRSSPSSILFSFEPVFGEEIDGVVREYKYRRKMVVKLSSLAAKAAKKLTGKGPWISRFAIAKDIQMNGGKQYKAIDELVVKGLINLEDDKQYWLAEGLEDAIELSAENAVAVKTAGTFLDGLLLRPDGTPKPEGAMYDMIEKLADQENLDMKSVRRARERRKVKSETRDGVVFWVAQVKTKTTV
jgi:hypothetical protein